LVPGVDAVLEDFLHGLEQAILATTFVRERDVQERAKFLRGVVFDEHASGAVAFLLEAVALWLYGGVVICRSNERDDEVFDGGEELLWMLDCIQRS
jgi:hypothetical protein